MKTERIKVELEGLTSLLMNRLSPESLKKKAYTKSGAEYDYEEEAKTSAYITQVDGKETLYIPAEAVFRCILGTARFYKAGKFRATRVLAGSMKVEPDKILLNRMDYVTDIRPVVIQRARVLRARARVENWKAAFEIVFDRDLITDPKLIKEILEDAGVKTGILDWRPEKGGAFGTFRVSKFEAEKKLEKGKKARG